MGCLPEEFWDGLRVAEDSVEETGQAQGQDGGDEKEQENQLLRQLGKKYYYPKVYHLDCTGMYNTL